jgi:NADH:ubiquinone oxidoreductase subunit 4 (subunit M)
MGAAPRHRLGVASGLVALSRTLGNTSGVPLMGAFFTAHVLAAASLPPHTDFLSAPPAALIAGFRGTYQLASLLALVGVVLAVAALVLARRRTAEQARG